MQASFPFAYFSQDAHRRIAGSQIIAESIEEFLANGVQVELTVMVCWRRLWLLFGHTSGVWSGGSWRG